MKLTEAKLKKMILETMYSPSTLIADALADPDVHPKIKDLLSSETEKDKRSGLQLLHTLYPDEYPEDGADHIHLGSEKYKKQFSIQNEPSHIALMRVKSHAYNFSKSINYSPKFPGDTGFAIYRQFREDNIIVSTPLLTRTRYNAYGLKELEAFKTYLNKNLGTATSEIEQQGSGEFIFIVFSDDEDLMK